MCGFRGNAEKVLSRNVSVVPTCALVLLPCRASFLRLICATIEAIYPTIGASRILLQHVVAPFSAFCFPASAQRLALLHPPYLLPFATFICTAAPFSAGFSCDCTTIGVSPLRYPNYLSLLNLLYVLRDRGIRPDALLVHQPDQVRLAQQRRRLRVPFIHLREKTRHEHEGVHHNANERECQSLAW